MASLPAYCEMCRAKLHGLTVTETELLYEGSITLDTDLLDASGMYPWERVQVVNRNNGARFETYIIPGERGSGTVCLNGPAARLAAVGDIVLVIAYGLVPDHAAREWNPTFVIVDKDNRVEEVHTAAENVSAT